MTPFAFSRCVALGFLTVVGAAGLFAQVSASPYFFDTLAGRASAGAKDGPVAEAEFAGPSGVAVDASGTIWVADSKAFTLRKISPAGIVSTVAGVPGAPGLKDGPAAAANFFGMHDVAVDQLGAIYVADGISIRKLGLDGQVSTLAGFPGGNDFPDPSARDGLGSEARFNGADALAVAPNGDLYVADSGANAVRRVTPAGNVTTLAGRLNASAGTADGLGPAAGFFAPDGIAVDAGGTAYVSEDGSHLLRRVLADGTVTTVAGSPNGAGAADGIGTAARFRAPAGLAVDVRGNVFVADAGNHAIRQFAPGGQVTTLAGQLPPDGQYSMGPNSGAADGTGGAASFSLPTGLALDAAGNLYVADYNNNEIRKVTPAGTVSTVAGFAPGRSRGATDGTGTTARFGGPNGVAVTANGVVFVADTGNHTIRRISATGEVTTFAGKAGEAGYADGVGSAARFNFPTYLAADANGVLYVLDDTPVIHRISPDGVVSTLAGNAAAEAIPHNGRGSDATFTFLMGIAVAPDGAIWVGERSQAWDPYTGSYAHLRRITPAGEVTTDTRILAWPHTYFGGLAFGPDGTLYATDVVYSQVYKLTATATQSELISLPAAFGARGVAVGPGGEIFLSGNYNDSMNGNRIGRLDREGKFEYLGGREGFNNLHRDGLGTDALFGAPEAIAAGPDGTLYVSCGDNTIRRGRPAAAPGIVAAPRSQTVTAGAAVQFSITANALPAPTYQWRFNGVDITGATAASYAITAAQPADAGDYTVIVSNALGSMTSVAATLTVNAVPSPGGGSGSTGGGNASGSSGGGGAPSWWFIAMLAGLGAARAMKGRPAP